MKPLSSDKVEASMYTWRRKMCMTHSKSSWDMVKDLMSDVDRTDKNHVLAERAETLLFCLKQRYPELSQTTLDTSKIQYNKASSPSKLQANRSTYAGFSHNESNVCHMLKQRTELTLHYCLQDVGQAVLESYSRVLESLAFNIVAWIEDVLFVDKTTKNQE
ncbi:UNVERIFIED_CONTAM: Rop guanine nucleotide exchange factor 3 [Sesamum calycinum]|uniref:Rop guanine nucleotide exchange factor 3 n=1 Tax=Sesamum calycinum TaxID=2727403 RepID=A0AAW2T0C0_9LAMI